MKYWVMTLVLLIVAIVIGSAGFLLGEIASDGNNYRKLSEDDEALMRQIAVEGAKDVQALEIEHNSNGGAYFVGNLNSDQKAELEARVIDAFGRRAAKKVLSGVYVSPTTKDVRR